MGRPLQIRRARYQHPFLPTVRADLRLHRAPDAGGLAYHVSHLNAGVPRADVLVGFSESPENQANGRGDIDLLGYVRVLHEAGYTGPLDLEVIGAKSYPVEQCCIIAAESRGHMQACLQACGAR